ncbi:HAD family hydrolase [Hamadaea tsunoensis]|uniref:HAD family hydrolase n=1 Tax=Hamadaea tsunoensis TaxID=53368 RepID=UPI0006888E65|nr:HAD family phosphatase [Hamadaea tsunoensis]
MRRQPNPTDPISAAALEPPPDAQALLFDWDGTLADSTTANYHSLREGLQEHGHLLRRDWFDQRTGLSTHEMVRLLAAETGAPLDSSLVARRRDAAFLDRFVHTVEPVRPVLDIARTARAQGRRLAIATGGTTVSFAPTLDHLGIRDLFTVIVTREDVDNGKPAPDLYLLALSRLGVPARDAVVYEDSDEGLRAAAAAGIDAIDVRPVVAPERLPRTP